IFFYPFTMIAEQLGGFGLIAIGIFSAAVFESFLYLIRNGALDWGPAIRARRTLLRSAAPRTTANTIRRVGTEGRERSVRPREGDEVAA
ncbi:MAG: NADH-quinone oxidoreductase subunit A, partial [Planctomycetaceae bacterium]